MGKNQTRNRRIFYVLHMLQRRGKIDCFSTPEILVSTLGTQYSIEVIKRHVNMEHLINYHLLSTSKGKIKMTFPFIRRPMDTINICGGGVNECLNDA